MKRRGLFDCPSTHVIGTGGLVGVSVLWRYSCAEQQRFLLLPGSCTSRLAGWPAHLVPLADSSKYVFLKQSSTAMHLRTPLHHMLFPNLFPTLPLPHFSPLILLLPTPQHLQMPRLLRQRSLRLPRQPGRVFLSTATTRQHTNTRTNTRTCTQTNSPPPKKEQYDIYDEPW